MAGPDFDIRPRPVSGAATSSVAREAAEAQRRAETWIQPIMKQCAVRPDPRGASNGQVRGGRTGTALLPWSRALLASEGRASRYIPRLDRCQAESLPFLPFDHPIRRRRHVPAQEQGLQRPRDRGRPDVGRVGISTACHAHYRLVFIRFLSDPEDFHAPTKIRDVRSQQFCRSTG